ncbi:zeta toxin family protein [Catalinimonas sp. 4WD22]|uniref:zeta toxin family protein n=1 Tax=Catalinimonas locisalis TaxID=3133978 RepID=UPI003100AF40
MDNKKLYVISGWNGAGKTTASFTILPEILECKEFVNADEIARGISPFQPEKVGLEAGRLMLKRIAELMEEGEDFAFETTLSTKSYKSKILKAQRQGYLVTLIFYWLETPQLAEKRVELRVKEGGHNIPKEIIYRRYVKGIQNLFNIYLPICDYIMIFDNSSSEPVLVYESEKGANENLYDVDRFAKIKKYLA